MGVSRQCFRNLPLMEAALWASSDFLSVYSKNDLKPLKYGLNFILQSTQQNILGVKLQNGYVPWSMPRNEYNGYTRFQ